MLCRMRWAAGVAAVVTQLTAAAPEVSVSGMLDSDVWSNFAGDFYANDELDMGMTLGFSDAVAAHVYTTVRGGAIPARLGEPGMRWMSVMFDGVDITFKTKTGTFAVGDLVYQYGKFNYYFYKRASMITPESFTRGLKYEFTAGILTQSILAGAADEADVLFEKKVLSTDGDSISMNDGTALEGNAGDIGAVSVLSLSESLKMSLFYGVRADVKRGFALTGTVFAGAELEASPTEMFKIKADVGMRNAINDDAITAEIERSTIVPVLLEPVITVGKFSTALSAYYVFDPDNSGEYPGAAEQMFVYAEPGYAFSESIAAGLPLEFHSMGVFDDAGENGEIWIVPTGYVYPFGGIQWWVWGGAYVPVGDRDPYFAAGSEIIVNF